MSEQTAGAIPQASNAAKKSFRWRTESKLAFKYEETFSNFIQSSIQEHVIIEKLCFTHMPPDAAMQSIEDSPTVASEMRVKSVYSTKRVPQIQKMVSNCLRIMQMFWRGIKKFLVNSNLRT